MIAHGVIDYAYSWMYISEWARTITYLITVGVIANCNLTA